MNSSLVDTIIYADHSNFSDGRSGYSLQKITVHHCAGVMSPESIGYLWQNPGRECSSHYGIGNDGRIGQYVDEYDTAWTDSNWVSNCTSVTIETSNCGYDGDWPVSDEAFNSLIRLCADISIRNNLGLLVPGQNLTWHSMYAATTCPGDYLRARMQLIADEANKIISGDSSDIEYQGHIENDGWTNWVEEGNYCGTTGESKRLEALRIRTNNNLKVEAMAHIESYGWVDYGVIDENTIIGTTGESKRLECLRLKISDKTTGEIKGKYMVHLEDYGNTPFTNADGIATLGTTGQALRIEGIKIEIFK